MASLRLLNAPLVFFLLGRLGQTVVNFISELQEQMCRFQKEISSKIQEKKASGIISAAESSSAAAAAAKVVAPDHIEARGNPSGLDAEADGRTRPLQDQDEEQQRRCGGESVGVAC